MTFDDLDFRDPITRFLSDNSLCVPLGQVVFFILLISGCLLVHKHKLGLLIAYCFVFYWGFVFNSDFFIDLLGGTSQGLYSYTFFGVFMVVMCIIGFFTEKKISDLAIFKEQERKPRSLIIRQSDRRVKAPE